MQLPTSDANDHGVVILHTYQLPLIAAIGRRGGRGGQRHRHSLGHTRPRSVEPE